MSDKQEEELVEASRSNDDTALSAILALGGVNVNCRSALGVTPLIETATAPCRPQHGHTLRQLPPHVRVSGLLAWVHAWHHRLAPLLPLPGSHSYPARALLAMSNVELDRLLAAEEDSGLVKVLGVEVHESLWRPTAGRKGSGGTFMWGTAAARHMCTCATPQLSPITRMAVYLWLLCAAYGPGGAPGTTQPDAFHVSWLGARSHHTAVIHLAGLFPFGTMTR